MERKEEKKKHRRVGPQFQEAVQQILDYTSPLLTLVNLLIRQTNILMFHARQLMYMYVCGRNICATHTLFTF